MFPILQGPEFDVDALAHLLSIIVINGYAISSVTICTWYIIRGY